MFEAGQAAQRVSSQVQLLQADQAREAAHRPHAVVGQVEHAQSGESVESGHSADVVTVQVQNLQVYQLFQTLDLAQSVAMCSGRERFGTVHLCKHAP